MKPISWLIGVAIILLALTSTSARPANLQSHEPIVLAQAAGSGGGGSDTWNGKKHPKVLERSKDTTPCAVGSKPGFQYEAPGGKKLTGLKCAKGEICCAGGGLPDGGKCCPNDDTMCGSCS